MKRYEHCTCDPSAKRYERCTRDWARCNTRFKFFVEQSRAKELAAARKALAK